MSKLDRDPTPAEFEAAAAAWANPSCGLTTRARNALIDMGVSSLDFFFEYAPHEIARELSRWRWGVGRKTSREIADAVEALRVLRGPSSYSHWGIF